MLFYTIDTNCVDISQHALKLKHGKYIFYLDYSFLSIGEYNNSRDQTDWNTHSIKNNKMPQTTKL